MTQARGDVIDRPAEKGPGFFDVLLVGRYCDVALLHHTVGGVRNFIQQHGVVLRPSAVQVVSSGGNEDLFLKITAVEPLVVDGDLRGGAGVQGVEQF